jgi:hypothetical protein
MELPLNGFETVFQPVAAPVRSEFLISPQIIVENPVRIFFPGAAWNLRRGRRHKTYSYEVLF